MNVTRREFIGMVAALALSACGSSGDSEGDGWHTTVVNGVSFDVMDGVELDESQTATKGDMTMYFLGGKDAPYSISYTVFRDWNADITGDYNVFETSGTRVYWHATSEGCWGGQWYVGTDLHAIDLLAGADPIDEDVARRTFESISF